MKIEIETAEVKFAEVEVLSFENKNSVSLYTEIETKGEGDFLLFNHGTANLNVI